MATPGAENLAALARAFPGAAVLVGRAADHPVDITIDAHRWRAGTMDLCAFDHRVDALAAIGDLGIAVVEDQPAAAIETCREILTRCQRWLPRRNRESATVLFDRVLAAHRALHDLSMPLVRADHDHAVDAWQWGLRLDPAASFSAQVATLFHDIERLSSEASARIEHRAGDYDAFKAAHAASGAAAAHRWLSDIGVPGALCRTIHSLIEGHERPPAPSDPLFASRRLLTDADALSWFSLNSAGFVAYFGSDHTRVKVRWTLARMSARARRWLATVRLPDAIAGLLFAAAVDGDARVPGSGDESALADKASEPRVDGNQDQA